MTQPVPVGDVRSRVLRTLAQNLLFDVLLAVIVVVVPIINAGGPVNWALLGASVLKTALVTAFAGVQRLLESRGQSG
jgi:hypothetical protein